MTFRSLKVKNWLIIGLAILSGVFAIQYAFGQNTGGRLNLNAPVSFPVDI